MRNWIYFIVFTSFFLIIIILLYFLKGFKFMGLLSNENLTNYSITFRTINPISISNFDPHQIRVAEEALISEHLFSSLVDFNDKGQIIPSLSSEFYWKNEELIFTFDLFSQTKDGFPITAEDAAISIRRLMVLKDDARHGDLTQLLCPHFNIISPFDESCPGIKVQNNKLILKTYDPKLSSFLLPLLASPEARIIPKKSLNRETFKIQNWQETSGPYFLFQDSPNGEIILEANKHSKLFHPQMPQKISFINGQYDIDDVFQKNLDVLSSDTTFIESEIHQLIDSNQYDIFNSLPIQLAYVKFSPAAMKDFNINQRFTLGRIIGTKLKKMFGSPFYGQQDTVSFFQSYSEGGLTNDQVEHLTQLRSKANDQQWPRKPRIGVRPQSLPFWKKEFADFEDQHGNSPFEFVPVTKDYYLLTDEEKPDTFIQFTDTGFYEDFSLISYQMKYGGLQLPEAEAKKWIEHYIQIDSKEERSKKLQELHYHALLHAQLYPIFNRPYTTVFKKTFTHHFSKFNLSTRLWQLRQ
jgi:hypothetical protein